VTIDVEDWIQSVFDVDRAPSDRFVRNTERVLDCLDRCGVRGTFFVLGLAARRAPELVRRIRGAGHEIQSHGFGHRRLHSLTPQRLRTDLDRSRKLLEDITGEAVRGYRAPAFSIDKRNLHALDIIAECGFEYDSSICPARTRRYGIASAPHTPHRILTPGGRTLLEIPVATASVFGRRVPTGGGGHLRLYPWRWVRRAIGAINRAGHSTALYMHPYEFAPDELRELASASAEGIAIPWHQRLHQGLGRRRFEAKIESLLRTMPFTTMNEVTTHAKSWPMFEYATDGTIRQSAVMTQAEMPRHAVPIFDEWELAAEDLPSRPVESAAYHEP